MLCHRLSCDNFIIKEGSNCSRIFIRIAWKFVDFVSSLTLESFIDAFAVLYKVNILLIIMIILLTFNVFLPFLKKIHVHYSILLVWLLFNRDLKLQLPDTLMEFRHFQHFLQLVKIKMAFTFYISLVKIVIRYKEWAVYIIKSLAMAGLPFYDISSHSKTLLNVRWVRILKNIYWVCTYVRHCVKSFKSIIL